MYYNMIILALTFFVVSCGGGGGGGGTSPTSNAVSFSMFPSGYFVSGYKETYKLSGSDTSGGTQTGTFAFKVTGATTFNGVSAIAADITVQITNTKTSAFISVNGIGYYSADLNDLRDLGTTNITSGTTTVSAVTNKIPLTAKIGDFGTAGTYTDSAGDVDVDTWRLDDGGNGRAKLVYSTTSKDQFGTLISTGEESYLIDQNGNRISLTFKLFDNSSGITITMSGNKT